MEFPCSFGAILRKISLYLRSLTSSLTWPLLCSYKSSPVFTTEATENLNAVLADDTAKVIFIENQVIQSFRKKATTTIFRIPYPLV